jgi:hypothetical protein
VPGRPGSAPLLILLESKRSQGLNCFHWQDKASAATSSLRLHEDLALSGHSLQSFIDPELPTVEVNVGPLKSESLAKSHASANGQSNQALNRLTSRRLKQFLRFFW